MTSDATPRERQLVDRRVVLICMFAIGLGIAAALSAQILVVEIARSPVTTLRSDRTIDEVRRWMATGGAGTQHQGYPVVDAAGLLTGVITRRDLASLDNAERTLAEVISGIVKFVYDDCTVRQAVDHLVDHNIGRLPVVRRGVPHQIVGIVTRSDLLSAYRMRIDEMRTSGPSLPVVAPAASGRNGPTSQPIGTAP
jgi:chloride channel protein, CIC family